MIYIFGDSFAADNSGWPGLFGEVKNFATRGSSEYRIWRKYTEHRHCIAITDTVIFCHTSWSRVYLKDENTSLLSRSLASHPQCDILLGDITAKRETKFMNIIGEIWDEDFQKYIHSKVITDCMDVPNSIHISFFQENKKYGIQDFSKYRYDYPGKTNHMDKVGNNLVAGELLNVLKHT